MILPANFADMGSMISAAMSVIKSNGSVGSNPTTSGKTAK
jgi:hypothetical protein